MKAFESIKYWIFDLDNTLYSGKTKVFEQVDKKMSEYISVKLKISVEEAKKIQKNYFYEYSTTLNGMIKNHKIDPKEFLNYVHNIDFSIVKPDEELNDLIKKIPGKKIIFTNADISYVKKILTNLNLNNIFYDIYDIEKMNFLPKPNMETYRKLIAKYNVDVKKAIFFDDIPQNLLPAAKLGLKTVHVYNSKLDEELNGRSKKIDYMTNNLKDWLKEWTLNN